MIFKKLFLPEQIFAQQIIGLEIGKNNICVSQVYQKKDYCKVQKITTINIDQHPQDTYDDQLANSLRLAFADVSGDQLRLTIPNSQVFFKELTIPFLDHQKIKLVLGYEIESAIPFPLHEAIFDFVITSQNKVKKESSVLVAVTKKKQIEFYLELIQKAKLKTKLSAVTIDLLGAYSLFTKLYAKQANEYDLLLEFGKNSITATALQQGKIRFVRNLTYGISTIINKISSATKKSQKEVAETLIRFGINQSEEAFLAPFSKLMDDLNMTFGSFKNQSNESLNLNRSLIVENTIEIKDFTKYLSEKTNLNCELINMSLFNDHSNFALGPGVQVTPANLNSIAAAITVPSTAEFNLNLQANLQSQSLIRYQIVTMASLTIILFASIYGISLFRTRNLNGMLELYKKQTLSILHQHFPGIKTSGNLATTINQALNKVNDEKKLWFSFSNQTRYGYLKYLQALTEAFEAHKVRLDLKKLTISDGVMTLQGTVEEFTEFDALEDALRSVPLFTSFTKLREKSFTIKITLKQNYEEM